MMHAAQVDAFATVERFASLEVRGNGGHVSVSIVNRQAHRPIVPRGSIAALAQWCLTPPYM